MGVVIKAWSYVAQNTWRKALFPDGYGTLKLLHTALAFLYLVKWEAPIFRHFEKPFLGNFYFLLCWAFQADNVSYIRILEYIRIFFTYANCLLHKTFLKQLKLETLVKYPTKKF